MNSSVSISIALKALNWQTEETHKHISFNLTIAMAKLLNYLISKAHHCPYSIFVFNAWTKQSEKDGSEDYIPKPWNVGC